MFQHWVYENPIASINPTHCDAKWNESWKRFMVVVDWTGLEQEMMTGWHRKLYIHQVPFYYVEYGLAQLGAVQVWANAFKNHTRAVKQYRYALSLGGTQGLPGLFAAEGAKFAFDARTLGRFARLMEKTIDALEAKPARKSIAVKRMTEKIALHKTAPKKKSTAKKVVQRATRRAKR